MKTELEDTHGAVPYANGLVYVYRKFVSGGSDDPLSDTELMAAELHSAQNKINELETCLRQLLMKRPINER